MFVVQIDTFFEKDLMQSLEIYRQSSPEGNKTIKEEFDAVQHLVNSLMHSIINLLQLQTNFNVLCVLYVECFHKS